jgi:DNA-binding transcriptional MocR family regulator
MLTSITTSQFNERLVYLMLTDGHYRKYLSGLHERLGDARRNVIHAFERIGLEVFAEPTDGMFVWARFPHIEDSLALAEAAQRDGIMLAPGTVFRPHLERSPWMRFNVANCENTRLQNWLQQAARQPPAPCRDAERIATAGAARSRSRGADRSAGS